MTLKDKALLALVILIWGFTFVVIRWGLEDVHPVMMTCLRFLVSALPWVFFIKRPQGVPFKYIIAYGLMFGLLVQGLLIVTIFTGMPSGLAALLIQLSPFISVMIAVSYFKEVFTRAKIIGIMVALVGFIIVVTSKLTNVSYVSFILIVLSAFFWSVCNSMLRAIKPENPLAFTVWSCLFIPIPLFIFFYLYLLLSGQDTAILYRLPSISGWLSILFQALLGTLLSFALWTKLINTYGLSNIAVYSLFVPIVALFLGWAIYQENLNTYEFIGSIFVIVGLVVINKNTINTKS